jgi:hypothetical protein
MIKLTVKQSIRVEKILQQLDGKGSDKERAAIHELRDSLGTAFPDQMLSHYRNSRLKSIRASCLFYCFPNARTSNAAKELAMLALRDKSKVVRYRACQLLAYSQDRNLLGRIEQVRNSFDAESRPDLEAALDAISNQNQNFFKDREHSGSIFMELDSR